MSVKIRMTRMGRRHRPFFRINAIDSRAPRDGRILEKLGHYDPILEDVDKQVVIDLERVKFWLDKGAVPSDSVSEILLKYGITTKHYIEKKERRAKALKIARKKGKPFTKAEQIAAEKAAAEEKAASATDAKAS